MPTLNCDCYDNINFKISVLHILEKSEILKFPHVYLKMYACFP